MELAIVGDGTAHKQQPQEPRCQCESGATNKEKLVDLVLLQNSIVESLLHWTQSLPERISTEFLKARTSQVSEKSTPSVSDSESMSIR